MSKVPYKFIPQARKDFLKLDGSQKKAVAKALEKMAEKPQPASEGGYGKPLGNRSGSNLSGYMKLKLKGSGIRIVYDFRRADNVSYIIVISMRKDEDVYKDAEKKVSAYERWLERESS